MTGRPDQAVAVDTPFQVERAIHSATGPELPRLLFWLADLLCIIVSFHAAYLLAPRIKAAAMAPDSLLSRWVSVLAPQVGGEYREMHEVAWVLVLMWVVSVLVLQGMGAYRPLLHQSRARIVLSTLTAPAAALGFIALVLFALRSPSWSRLFIFLFTGLTAVSLCAYRSAIRSYRVRRAASGVYASSVAFVGSPAAVEWLRLYFDKRTSPAQYRVIGWFSVTDSTSVAAPLQMPADGFLCLGSVGQLGALLVHRPIHEIVAIQGTASSEWL